MNITDELRSNIRSSLRQHLELLGSLEMQREDEHFMSPTELICVWFDDFYHPDSPAHQQAFTSTERQLLEAFSERFGVVSAAIEEMDDVRELQKRRDWVDLAVLASQTLAGIPEGPPDPPLHGRGPSLSLNHATERRYR